MTILIGTDFSQASNDVADVAAEVARRRGEALLLAHVTDGPLLPFVERQIEAEAHRLRAFGCVVRSVIEREGSIGKSLSALAEREQVALLVVGAQGGGLRSLLGTVATQAIRHAECPTLVVRQPKRLWLQSKGTVRALVPFAVDGTEESLPEALSLIASTGDFDADFVHYKPIPEPLRSSGVSIKTNDALRTHFADLPLGLNIRSVNERDGFGRIDSHICDLAVQLRSDIIVCGSHHRHGFERGREGSIAEGIVRHSPVSVLVARAPSQHEVQTAEQRA